MASPFNIKKTTSVGRNGFDLSQRHLFGAVCGMLLPIMHEETLPGDSFKLRLDSFTRMRPMQTAAFARFKEYFDFYFVSKDTLWPYYNAMVVNNNEPQSLPNLGTSVPQQVPCYNNMELKSWLANQTSIQYDDMDVPFDYGTTTLYDLLGCGDIQRANLGHSDMLLSLLPWAAYQRIYADFYRNPQWERRDPVSYNLRSFYNTTNQLSEFDARANMFKIRYSNWHKDYFMGLYPTQQFGDVSVVSSPNLMVTGNLTQNVTANVSAQPGELKNRLFANNSSFGYPAINSMMSIIDLRRAQALQRLKEVTMTNGSSMYQQVKAHYGFELPEGRKDAPEFIGSFDNSVVINSVDAHEYSNDGSTNSTSPAQQFGKASSASNIEKSIDFTAKDFGYIFCIYHVEPLLEYSALGIKRSNTKLSAADEFIPEFDKIGFGSLQSYELLAPNGGTTEVTPFTLGYSSRYLDLKASYDRIHGSFMKRDFGSTDEAWAVGLGRNILTERLQTKNLDFRFFKVDPYITNTIMQVEFNDSDISGLLGCEPFMVAADFNIFKTSNMSVDSLPY